MSLAPSLAGRRIALVEDDEIMGGSIAQRLEIEGAEVLWLKRMARALGALRTPRAPIDAVVCDIRLPDGTGEELYRTLCRSASPPPFLFITGQGGIDQAVRLMRAGAADYVTKPFEMGAFLERLALSMARRDAPEGPPLLGVSPSALRVEALAARAAARDGPVLIRGGPGTGKGLVARRIHALSDRRAAPFVALDAQAGPKGGIEAVLAHVGEGVLFVAALEALCASSQDALLPALRGRLDARVIAACGPGVEARVASGEVRGDSFYLLGQTEIVVPPLGERPDDAVWLLGRLFDALNARRAPPLDGVSAFAEAAVRAHGWPGGGRELRSRLIRGLGAAEGPWLQPADLFPEDLARGGLVSLAEARDAAEHAQIRAALVSTGGHLGEAAKLLRVARTTLWEKMRRLGLS